MSSCENIRERLGAWLDGEISGAEAESVGAHVESCAVCARERRQLERLEFSVRAALVAGAPRLAFQPFWRGVEARITKPRAWYQELLDGIRTGFASPRLVWAVPLAILILIAVSSVDSFLSGWRVGPRNNFAAVESIDAYGRSVGLFREDETKTTVIWLYQNQEGEDEPSGENTEASPSF